MGDAVDFTFDEFDRCCNGCRIMKGGENTLHKTGGRRNPNGKRTVFFANQQIFWGQTTLVLGTVEIRNFTELRQKILWYNSRIPAPAINDLLPTSR